MDQVTKTYPDGTTAVDRLSLRAETGRLTVLVGPSGCGKTTSLRMINRMIEPTSGVVRLGGEPTAAMDAALLRRRIGYVIQHAGLFPHRTVVDNVCAMPRLLGTPTKKARADALELLERVGLGAGFARRYPWQLSGGQQQRVGVARALATDPQFLLMDEPFSAVDPVVRGQLQQEFLRLQQDLGKTIVMITHDIDEALTLGDQVVVLREGGHVAQAATPAQLLAAPADRFVADFVGRDRGYRALGFTSVAAASLARPEAVGRLGEAVPVGATGDHWLLVVDHQQRPLGWVDTTARTSGTGTAPGPSVGPVTEADLNRSGTTAPATSTLRELLDAALSSPSRRAVVVDEFDRVLGVVPLTVVAAALEGRGAASGATT